MTDYILEQLRALVAIDSPSGFTEKVTAYVLQELTRLGFAPQRTIKGGVLCCLGGSGNGLLLTGHIDTLGGMVAAVKPNGRLRISPIGGLSANNCEAENCRVYGRFGGVVEGCLQLCSPSVHVNKSYSEEKRDFTTMEVVLDAVVHTKEETEALGVSVGDYVCFDPRLTITETGYIKSRFLDDKLSVAILLGLAKSISEKETVPAREVWLHVTVFEEVGHGGCASVPAGVQEILAVDMGCVGDDLGCTETQVSICAKDSRGPYNYDMTTKLIALAKEAKLDYAVDVYPYYGSDADAALEAGHDLRHALIGAGVYASHGYERSHKEGVKNTYQLVKAFVETL